MDEGPGPTVAAVASVPAALFFSSEPKTNARECTVRHRRSARTCDAHAGASVGTARGGEAPSGAARSGATHATAE
eukprot:3546221-Pyramimonas_sp.AAC.2